MTRRQHHVAPRSHKSKSKRAVELEAMEAERDAYRERAHAAEKQLSSVSLLVSIYWRQDEPKGQVSARRALTAIAETFAQECSICRCRHGVEVQHACE